MGTNVWPMLERTMAEHGSQLGRNHQWRVRFQPRSMEKMLFMKVIRLRLRSPPTAGIEEEVRDPEHYELKSPVVPDEFDDE